MPWKPTRDKGCLASRTETDAAYRGWRERDESQRAVDALRRCPRWVHTRAWVLAHEPLCRECASLGFTTEATDVDHIVPLRERPDLAYDASNLQPLCRMHHVRKTRAGR